MSLCEEGPIVQVVEQISALKQPKQVPTISVLIPIYDEEKNIPILCACLVEVLDRLGTPFEVVLVNDGSRDGSWRELQKVAALRPELKVVNLRRNYGQTAALMAAIDVAEGEILVPMDAD